MLGANPSSHAGGASSHMINIGSQSTSRRWHVCEQIASVMPHASHMFRSQSAAHAGGSSSLANASHVQQSL